MKIICALVFIAHLLTQALTFSVPKQQMVVYPSLLEGRSVDGRKTLKITDDLTLNLESSSVFSDSFLLITTEDDGEIRRTYAHREDYEENLYHDEEKMASVMMTSNEGALEVDGIIGDTLRIKPLLGSERSSDGRVAHLLSRISMRRPSGSRTPQSRDDQTQGSDSSTGTPGDNNHVNSSASAKDYVTPPPMDNTATESVKKAVPEERAVKTQEVETHIVVEATHAEKFKNDKKKIIKYLATLTNAVNLRYNQMKNPPVKIVIVGVTLPKKGKEPYLKRLSSNAKVIKPMDTVMELAKYMGKNLKKDYEKADFVMLITMLDIGSFEGDSTSGFTMFGTVCGEYKTGSFEDEPDTYDATYIFAHEMAHGLGVVHDGDGRDNSISNHPGARSCRYSDGYIMGEYSFEQNHYLFSSCSIKQIENTFSLKSKYACLHKKNAPKRIPASTKYPGDIVKFDDLCRIGLKHLSGVYAYDKEKGVTNCEVNCIKHESGGWKYYSSVGALDGSQCDSTNKKKACFNGKCVDSAKYKIKPATKKPKKQ